MIENSYTGIATYEGLNGLRHERAMYLGATTLLDAIHAPRALTQTVQEAVSNSIDEYTAGAGDTITVTIHKDNSITIADYGRGMPKGPGDSFDDVTRSLTVPHSSGKFKGDGYAAMGTAGMHGIGLKATAATSRYMTLQAICYSVKADDKDNRELTGGFEEYIFSIEQEKVIKAEILRQWDAKDVEIISLNTFKDLKTGEIVNTGTSITYLPDDGPVSEDDTQPVFESINWVNADLYPRFNSSAFLNAGLTITFTDERKPLDDEDAESDYLTKSWHYKDGLTQYVTEISKSQQLLSKMTSPISFDEVMSYEGYDYRLQCAMIFTDELDSNLISYVNSIPTHDGGPHVDGFKTALTKSINDYAKANDLNRPVTKSGKKGKPMGLFSQSDVLDGLNCVFEIRVPGALATFEGQTKEKLATTQAKPVAQEIVYNAITNWLYDNMDAAAQIIEKIIETKNASDAAKKARAESKKARQNRNVGSLIRTNGKLKAATHQDPSKNELFCVEGDSASNIGRDKKYQAVLPFRGKIPNTSKYSISDVLGNAELATLVHELGCGIGPSFDIKNMRYKKVVIAVDPDADGYHIALLFLRFFSKFLRPLIEQGFIYIAELPLYKATKYKGGKIVDIKKYYTEHEMSAATNELLEGKYIINRFKGLGEMNPDEVGEMLTDPKNRVLRQLKIEDDAEFNQKMVTFMGDNASLRTEWVTENVDYDAIYEAL